MNMNERQGRLLKKFSLFVGLGMGFVVLFFVVMIFFHILAWGIVIGAVLFVLSWIKERFFPQKLARRDDFESESARIIIIERENKHPD